MKKLRSKINAKKNQTLPTKTKIILEDEIEKKKLNEPKQIQESNFVPKKTKEKHDLPKNSLNPLWNFIKLTKEMTENTNSLVETIIATENMSEQGVENSLILKSKVSENCELITQIIEKAARKMDKVLEQ